MHVVNYNPWVNEQTVRQGRTGAPGSFVPPFHLSLHLKFAIVSLCACTASQRLTQRKPAKAVVQHEQASFEVSQLGWRTS